MEVEYVYQRPSRKRGGRYIAHIRTNNDVESVFADVVIEADVVSVQLSGTELFNGGSPELYQYWTSPTILIDTGGPTAAAQVRDVIAALELAGRYAENPDLLIQHWRENGSREEDEINVYEKRLRNQPA